MSERVHEDRRHSEWQAWKLFFFNDRIRLLQYADTVLVLCLILAILTRHLGTSGAWFGFAALPLAVIVVVFVCFALVTWERRSRGPGDPAPASDLLYVLVLVVAGTIESFSILYWRVAGQAGPSAFYAAVGTMTAVNPFKPTDTTGNLLLVGQELVDLVLISCVIPVVLSRAFEPKSSA